jgi:uncharacterized membrane protein
MIYLNLLVLDAIYLSFIGKPLFGKMITNITNKQPTYNIVGIIGSYLFLLLGLQYFIINKNMTPNDAFVLGLVIYGVFDTTNLALFDGYDIRVAMIDILWGGILFYLVTKMMKK